MKKLAGKFKRALAIALSAVMAASVMPAGGAIPGGAAYAAEAEGALPSVPEEGNMQTQTETETEKHVSTDSRESEALKQVESAGENSSQEDSEESKAPESGNGEDESASAEESASAKESASAEATADAGKNENEAETEESSFEDASGYESETAESEASQELLGADGEFSAEEMPDETLRAYVNGIITEILKNPYHDTTTPIRTQIKRIEIIERTLREENYEKAVRSLEGIGLLPNLEEIDFRNQDIADITPLASLSKLKKADLSYNKVTGIPSLVNLNSLETLSLGGNKIPESEFDDSKMPLSFLEANKNWKIVVSSQRRDAELLIAEAYPYSSEKFFFYVEIDKVRNNYGRAWTVTASFDNKTPCTLDRKPSINSFTLGYIADIPGLEPGEHTVALEAQEDYGGEKITLATRVKLIPGGQDMKEQIWLEPGVEHKFINIEVTVPYQADEIVEDVKLAEHGKPGNTLGIASINCRVSSMSEKKDWYVYNSGGNPFRSEIPDEIQRLDSVIVGSVNLASEDTYRTGSYDLIIKTNKDTYTFENYAVSDYPGPLITSMQRERGGDDMPLYDNYGEYFHVRLTGTYLKTEGFYPVLKLLDGTLVTDESFAEPVVGTYVVYKLKKNGNFPKAGNLYCDIATRPGYPPAKIGSMANRLIPINDLAFDKEDMARICYNSKTRQYVMYTDSRIPDGSKLKIALKKYELYSSDTIQYDEASNTFPDADSVLDVTVSGREMILDFKDSAGNPFPYPHNAMALCYKVAAEVNGTIYTYYWDRGVTYTACGFGPAGSPGGDVAFMCNFGVGACGLVRYQDCTVEIYSNSDGKHLASISIPDVEGNNNQYYFTKEDLKDIIKNDPNLEKLYKLEIKRNGVPVYTSSRGVLNIGYVGADPTGIALDKTSAEIAKDSSLTLTATLAPADATTVYTWTSSNTEVAAVDGSSRQAVVTAKKAGTATITVKTGNGKSASCTVTVKAEELPMFNAGLYQGADVPMTAQADGSYSMSVGETSFYLKNETNGNSKSITYKISDKSVVKMGKISTDNDIAKIPLTPLKAGTALLTVAASSGAKTKQEFVIRVTHAAGTGSDEDKAALAETISLNRTSVSVNPALSVSDAAIAVYNGFGGTLESAVLTVSTGSKLAGIKAEIIKANGINTNEIRFFAEGGSAAPVGGKGKLKVTLKAGGVVIEQVFDINVAVKEIAPLVTVKQLDKLNTFYKDKPGRFSVGSPDGVIEDVTIKAVTSSASDASMAKGTDYIFANGVLTIKKVPEGTKKLDFTVKVAGYKSGVEKKNIALAAETANLRLSASSGTVYTGDNVRMSTSVRLFDKATGMAVDLSRAAVEIEKYDGASKKYIAAAGYTPNIKEEKLVLTASVPPDASGDKLKLKFTSTDWNEDKAFYFTVKGADIAKAALALGKTSLVLYNYSDKPAASAETALTLKGGSEEFLSGCEIDEIVAGNAAKAQGNTLKAEYKDAESMVKVSKISESLEAGSYKFKVSLNGSFWQKPLETTLTVKVVNVDMAENSSSRAKVAISAKGIIDVLNRAGTPIVITPKFTNVPADAKVTEVRLTGDNADLFEIAGPTGRQAAVVLSENATVYTKPETPYKLGVIYTIQAGDTVLALESNSVNIKLVQKKPKVKASGENVFSSTRGDTKPIRFALTNSIGALIDAGNIGLQDAPEDFTYDFSKGELIYTPRGATSSGQSYALKFAVYPAGCGINEKPLTVSYKVKIAK